MRDRAFGVEIECGFPGGPYRAADLLDRSGFTEWASGDIHSDGTNTEIPSPILRGAEGLRELQSVFALLLDNGAYVTAADGMHVHHDAPEFIEDDDLVERLLDSWANNQDVISQFVSPYRRDDHWACTLMDRQRVDDIKRNATHYKATGAARSFYNYSKGCYENRPWKLKDFAGRAALNVSSLDEHGTIEFRQHEGTLDFAHAKAWIMFGQAFLDSVVRRKKPFTCSDTTDLLRRVNTAPSAALVLAAKVESPTFPEARADRDDYDWDDSWMCDCCRACCGSCGCCCGCDDGGW